MICAVSRVVWCFFWASKGEETIRRGGGEGPSLVGVFFWYSKNLKSLQSPKSSYFVKMLYHPREFFFDVRKVSVNSSFEEVSSL